MLYRILTKHSVFGIITEKGKVIIAAPIAKWAIGKPIHTVLAFYKQRGNTIERIQE